MVDVRVTEVVPAHPHAGEDPVHDPPEFVSTGTAVVSVYVSDDTAELVHPTLVASALIVVAVAVTLIAPLYVCVGELSHVPGVAAPGVLPSTV